MKCSQPPVATSDCTEEAISWMSVLFLLMNKFNFLHNCSIVPILMTTWGWCSNSPRISLLVNTTYLLYLHNIMHLKSYFHDFIHVTLWLTCSLCLLHTGVSVFPIGLGNQYDQTELSTLAGRHAQDNIIRLSSTEYLLAMAALDQSFTDKLCRGETHIYTHSHTGIL